MAEVDPAARFSPLTLSRYRHAPLVAALAATARLDAEGAHFAVYRLPDACVIVHDLAPGAIDNDIAGLVASELVPMLDAARDAADGSGYRLSEQQVFEGCVGAIVRSIDANERRAWHLFYENTLAALHYGKAEPVRGNAGAIADFRAIYRQAAALIADSNAETVLDVATCFGFLPLYLATSARAPALRRIVGCDLNPALVALAADYQRHRGIEGVAFIRGDVLAPGLAQDLAALAPSFDVVTAIHLLEHLTWPESERAIDALWALSRLRLIIAVPFEAEPDACFGHRQTFDRATLARLAARTGGRVRGFEHHGGWAVIDRESSDVADGVQRQ